MIDIVLKLLNDKTLILLIFKFYNFIILQLILIIIFNNKNY